MSADRFAKMNLCKIDLCIPRTRGIMGTGYVQKRRAEVIKNNGHLSSKHQMKRIVSSS
jgi:hypothetical protein